MIDFELLAKSQTYPSAALFVVATPIGNLADITFRALYILQMVDIVAAEDTRHTQQLLSRYGIQQTLFALHQHNEISAAQQLIEVLKSGKRVAYVSDAGTPGLSDPGAKLVEMVREAGFAVVPIPGASALTCAMSVAPFWAQQFTFLGFLPNKAMQRLQILRAWLSHPCALVLYEAPHRILETINALLEVFGQNREILIGRELTKLHEECFVGNLADAFKWFEQLEQRTKGEFIVIVQGQTILEKADEENQHDALLKVLLSELPLKTAVNIAQKLTQAKKNILYTRALYLKTEVDKELSIK